MGQWGYPCEFFQNLYRHTPWQAEHFGWRNPAVHGCLRGQNPLEKLVFDFYSLKKKSNRQMGYQKIAQRNPKTGVQKKKSKIFYGEKVISKSRFLGQWGYCDIIHIFPESIIRKMRSKLLLKKTKQKKNEAVYHLRLSTHLIPGGCWQILSSYPTIHNSDFLSPPPPPHTTTTVRRSCPPRASTPAHIWVEPGILRVIHPAEQYGIQSKYPSPTAGRNSTPASNCH